MDEVVPGPGSSKIRLSGQELAVLKVWLTGMSKSSVARRLDIGENTVKGYIARARRKYADGGHPVPTKELILARLIEDGLVSLTEITLYTSHARHS